PMVTGCSGVLLVSVYFAGTRDGGGGGFVGASPFPGSVANPSSPGVGYDSGSQRLTRWTPTDAPSWSLSVNTTYRPSLSVRATDRCPGVPCPGSGTNITMTFGSGLPSRVTTPLTGPRSGSPEHPAASNADRATRASPRAPRRG